MSQAELSKENMLIEEYGEEYKSLLRKYVLDYSSNNSEMDISILSTIDKQAKRTLKITEKNKRKHKVINMLGILGVIYALIGFIILFICSVTGFIDETEHSNGEIIIYITFTTLSMISTIFSMLSLYLRTVETRRYVKEENLEKVLKNNKTFEFQIIMLWKEIEMLLYKLADEKETTSLSSILKALYDANTIDKKDMIQIKAIYEYRNLILHNQCNNTNNVLMIFKTGKEIVAKLCSKL